MRDIGEVMAPPVIRRIGPHLERQPVSAAPAGAPDCALRWRLEMLVAEAVGRALAALGVDVVFGLRGSGTLAVTTALRDAGVPFHASRHEGGAICMADGYGRVSGRLPACSV